MAEIKIIEEDWKPGQSKSQYKPAKLARYSFGNKTYTYKYDYNIPDASTDFYVNIKAGVTIINLTSYFSLALYESYSATSPFVTITRSNLPYKLPKDVSIIKAQSGYEKNSYILTTDEFSKEVINKDITPLNIINNKKNEIIYKDLRLEVYVKSEAIVKNFIDNFDLNNLGDVFFQANSNNVYNISQYKASTYYSVGTCVKSSYGIHCCVVAHTSAEDSSIEFLGENKDKWELLNIIESNLININKNINESYYSSKFPYVSELIFKNIWGCDLRNNLQLYRKNGYLAITYPKAISENLKSESINKFFEQGYIKKARFILGETFDKDSILGETKLDNYFSVVEISHSCSSDWVPSLDSVVTDIFKRTYMNPFDCYYNFSPKLGIPFFKDRDFTDSYIQLLLERKDVLGNIYQRIVKLPVHTLFVNNLIKVYFKNTTDKVYSEYLSSQNEYFFISNKGGNVHETFTIWCPNVNKLTVSSTCEGATFIKEPEITAKNGQRCLFESIFDATNLSTGSVVRISSIFEYSDGENYDKFIFNTICTLN